MQTAAGLAATTAFLGRPGEGIGVAGAHAASPFPDSSGPRLARVDESWLWRRACGSDQWPHVAIDGSSILCGWGDGWGWRFDGGKSYLGYTRISGSAANPVGNDGWSDRSDRAIARLRAKPCSLLPIGDTVYAYVTGDVDDRDATRLLRSPLQGNDFDDTGRIVMRRSVHGLQVVGTVHHRIGELRDRVVLVADRGNVKDIYGGTYNKTVWAARVGASNFDDIDEWEWYCGVDSDDTPIWARGTVRDGRFDLSSGRSAQPIIDDPAGAGKHVMITWCPSLDGYVLSKTHQRNSLGLFYSRTWRGPWRTLFYDTFVPGGGQAVIFTAQVVQMWSEGGTVAVLWSGFSGGRGECSNKASNNYDAVHLTRFAVR